MALTGPLVIGPDRSGRRVAVVDGLIAAAPPDGARASSPAPTARSPPARFAPTPISTAGWPATACRPPRRRRKTSCGFSSGSGGGSTVRSTPRRCAPPPRTMWRSALLAGTTALVDHHESPHLIEGSLAILAEACERLGMRALLCYGATERNFGREEARARARRMPPRSRLAADPRPGRPACELHRLRRHHPRGRRAGARAGHRAARACRRGSSRRRRRPRARLRRPAGTAGGARCAGAGLDPGAWRPSRAARRWDATDARGCWLVQNPRSNEGNGVGYAANLRYARRVALGTDGWNADMAEEDGRAGAPRQAPTATTARRGRLAAGQALIAERFAAVRRSRLAPGALGDLVVREDGRVRHVVVGGRIVVRERPSRRRRHGCDSGRRASACRASVGAHGGDVNEKTKGTEMARLGLERSVVDAAVLERTAARLGQAGVVLPTIAQLKDPSTIPAARARRARRRRSRRAPMPSICFACTGSTAPTARAWLACRSISNCRPN